MEPASSIRIGEDHLAEDRFSRLRLIQWWDHQKIQSTRVLVVGAGALGNEIIKNLALLGFRQVLIVDLDDIEDSNLSRSILFRPDDIGKSKSEVAARAAREIYPDMVTHHLRGDIARTLGLGIFRWADVILAGLDNREARLWINRAAWKMNRPWIDGAIEGIQGVARVFLPNQAPCYECTLGEADWAIIHHRMSCNLLSKKEMLGGRVPTTPTISSIIAGVQVQETVKLIHGLPCLAGKGLIFDGLHHTSYVVEYTPNEDCLSHETYGEGVVWQHSSADTTLRQLWEFGRDQLGGVPITLEFSRDVIGGLRCPRCGLRTEIFLPLGTVTEDEGRCPQDGTLRTVETTHNFSGEGPLGDLTIHQAGLPSYDVFVARTEDVHLPIFVEGDRWSVLGPLASLNAKIPA